MTKQDLLFKIIKSKDLTSKYSMWSQIVESGIFKKISHTCKFLSYYTNASIYTNIQYLVPEKLRIRKNLYYKLMSKNLWNSETVLAKKDKENHFSQKIFIS